MSGASSPPALRCTAITKSYAGVRVLKDFECSIAGGEVHALLGENGSGKSTFIKTLAGVVEPDADSGAIEIGGHRLTFGSPASSFELGCRFVHQDLGLIDELSVLDNMHLVSGFNTRFGAIRTRAALSASRDDLERIGLDIDPRTLVGDLSPARKTGVAVARAMSATGGSRPQVLVLDEPTATLPDDEVQHLMQIVRGAQASGVGILYVTHRLDEVFELDGTVTVLRDGERIITESASRMDKRQLINLMAGEELATELAESSRREVPDGGLVLRVRGVTGGTVRSADLDVRSGEIVGVAGITGSGRESFLPLVFGGARRWGGDVTVDGRAVAPGRPRAAVEAGMGYLPPDRKIAGFRDLSVTANTTLADLGGFSSPARIDRASEQAEAEQWISRMQVRPTHALDLLLSNLSGGNQQKVLFAKWLRLGLSVFLLDDPTQGVDVHAKALLHRQLIAAADEGLAAVVASTDVDELASLCDRVLIFRGGIVAAELIGAEVTVRAITHACLDSGSKVTA